MTPSSPFEWHFDVDRYLNPLVPSPPLPLLPYPLAYFLGYRTSPLRPLGNIAIVFWAFLGVFCGLTVIELVSHQIPSFHDHGAPIIIGSFGAAAVLEFYAIESPLAQPRNVILGQLLSCIIGVSVCKLFAFSPHAESLRWLAGSIACATATAVMVLTGTVHPPAGATALIVVVDDDVIALGWYLIPVVMLGCTLMLCTALLVNNVQRRFPLYWWTLEEVGQYWRETKPESETENGIGTKFTLSSEDPEISVDHVEDRKLVITKRSVIAPDGMYLRPEERLLLESLSERL